MVEQPLTYEVTFHENQRKINLMTHRVITVHGGTLTIGNPETDTNVSTHFPDGIITIEPHPFRLLPANDETRKLKLV